MTDYTGEERRRSTKDHDTLIQLVQILTNHVDNFNTHSNAFRAHEMQDQANFDKLRTSITKIERIIWVATGIIIALDALPKIIEVVHVLNK